MAATFEITAADGASQQAAAESESVIIQPRIPRRVIHCSDGIIEEFSDDDDDATDAAVVAATASDALAIDEVCF